MNLGPMDYESTALTAELRAHLTKKQGLHCTYPSTASVAVLPLLLLPAARPPRADGPPPSAQNAWSRPRSCDPIVRPRAPTKCSFATWGKRANCGDLRFDAPTGAIAGIAGLVGCASTALDIRSANRVDRSAQSTIERSLARSHDLRIRTFAVGFCLTVCRAGAKLRP